tara:strand:+ start:13270 stop:14187 length:918 start_codon:yes stop_codon:yes gene_type:complete
MQMHKGNDLNRWMVSFADFMTLMFAVFVVLYAVSLNDKEQYKDVMLSIQNASKLLNKSIFSSNNEGILTHNSNVIMEQSGDAILSEDMPKQADDELSEQETDKIGNELNTIKLSLKKLFTSELDEKNVSLDLKGDWLTIEMGGDILFAGGSHTLLFPAVDIVEKISQVLVTVNNLIRIRGYSDQERVANEIYRSNWELSGMRAFSVLHQLSENGIPGERMVVEAYGRFSPLFDENNNIEPLKSRRVVIAISKYAVVSIDKNIQTSEAETSINNSDAKNDSPKKDSEEMREVYLPNNRLIITTRQE